MGKKLVSMGAVSGMGSMAGGHTARGSEVDWQKRHQEQLKKENDAWERAKKEWKSQARMQYKTPYK